MNLKLSELRSRGEKLTRTFAFPPGGTEKETFTVKLSYLSPALFEEKKREAQVKHTGHARKGKEPQLNLTNFKEEISRNVLLKALHKIDGVTLRKLKPFVPLNQEQVSKAGGLDAAIEMDSENIVDLLVGCPEFFEWTLETCTNLENYQDEEWEDQVKNFESGLDSNTDGAKAQ
jgi:hypothetical protein